MREKETIEKVGVLENLFSYDGTFKRINYLIYGLAIPLTFVIGGLFLPSILNGQFFSGGIGIALIIFALPVFIAATVKRAKDMKESPSMMVIGSFIPYLGFLFMLILLLVPTKKEKPKKEKSNFRKYSSYVVLGIAVLFLIALVIPQIMK